MINKEQENDSLKNQDKEQVIIDGVDVSKCKHHRKCILPDNIGCKIDDFLCCDKPNCDYKQLQRKEQELIDYKKQFKADTKEMENYQNEIVKHLESIEYLRTQLRNKEQECEELKEQLQANQPTGICETCMAKAILQNDKYRKALEEIENFTKKHCDYWCERNKILDIINKAKGQK